MRKRGAIDAKLLGALGAKLINMNTYSYDTYYFPLDVQPKVPSSLQMI